MRLDAHLLAAQDLVLGARYGAIELDGAGLDPALQPLPRILGQQARQGLVQAQSDQVLGNIECRGYGTRRSSNSPSANRELAILAGYGQCSLGQFWGPFTTCLLTALARGLILALCITSVLLTGL